MMIVRSPAGAPLGPGSPRPLSRSFEPVLDARRDLHDERLGPVVAPVDLDGGLTAADGGQERDREMGLHRPARPRPARPAGLHPAQQVLEEPRAGVLILLLDPRAPRPPPMLPKNWEKSTFS